MLKHDTQKFICTFVSGTLLCIIIGLLFLGIRIFHPRDPAFQFTIYGLSGSLLYAILQLRNFRNFIYACIFLVVFILVLFRVTSIPIIVSRFLYIAAVAFSVYIYHISTGTSLKDLFLVKPVFLAGLFAIQFLILMLVTGLFIREPDIRFVIEGQTFFGLLIGFGMGLGFELAEILDRIYLSSPAHSGSAAPKERL